MENRGKMWNVCGRERVNERDMYVCALPGLMDHVKIKLDKNVPTI